MSGMLLRWEQVIASGRTDPEAMRDFASAEPSHPAPPIMPIRPILFIRRIHHRSLNLEAMSERISIVDEYRIVTNDPGPSTHTGQNTGRGAHGGSAFDTPLKNCSDKALVAI
jgi:hypothetical protein